MRVVAVVSFALAVASQAAADQVKQDFALSGAVAPGSPVTIKGDWTASNQIPVFLRAVNTTDDTPVGNTEVASEQVKFIVPSTMKPGLYTVRIGSDKALVVPGTLEVPAAVTFETINPTTQYRGPAGTFDFTLVGDHFSTDACYDDVVVQGQDSIVKFRGVNAEDCRTNPNREAKAKACPEGSPGAKPGANTPQGTCLWVESSRLMHIVGYPASSYQGPMRVSVRVGNASSEQRQLVLARRSPAAIFVLSAGATAVLFLIVSWTVSHGLAHNKIGTRRLNLLETFILDSETNTYSLSKFQLLLFSATFIFGYLYVFLAIWLVQWKFTLPDVPPNIAGLLGFSGGTAIAAAGLTAARGSKGAGLQYPTGADLISTGGVVVGERFQFFVWTIVACVGFVMLLINQDPAKVDGFPQFPDGLLYVMGVSAASYLGGKAARKPGPIIQNIAPDVTTNELIVQGQNLASDGRFFIDGKELPIVPESQRTENTRKNLIQATPQLDAADTKFCTELKITIAAKDIDITQGEHRFRVVNRDGQFADVTFSAQQPTITAVYPEGTSPPDPPTRLLPAGDASITAVVKGQNLRVGSQVTWQPQGAAEPTEVSITSQKGDTELNVSLVPGPPGQGKLVLTTPSGFVANPTIKVEDSSDARTPPAPTPTPPPPSPQTPTPPSPPATTPSGSTSAEPIAPASSQGNVAPAQGPAGSDAAGNPAPAAGPQGGQS